MKYTFRFQVKRSTLKFYNAINDILLLSIISEDFVELWLQ